jgi:hypothetical protein
MAADDWAWPGAEAVVVIRSDRDTIRAERVNIARLTKTQIIVPRKRGAYHYEDRYRLNRPNVDERVLWVSYPYISSHAYSAETKVLHHPESRRAKIALAHTALAEHKSRFSNVSRDFADDPTHATSEAVRDQMLYLLGAALHLENLEKEEDR